MDITSDVDKIISNAFDDNTNSVSNSEDDGDNTNSDGVDEENKSETTVDSAVLDNTEETVTVEDCTQEGKNKALYDYMKDKYLWYQYVPDLDYSQYESSYELLDALVYSEVDRWSYLWENITITHDAYFNEGKAYGTFGFQLAYYEDGIYVQYVFTDSPAYRAGFRRGMEILAINGKSIEEIDSEEAWSDILGTDLTDAKYSFDVRMGQEYSTFEVYKDTVVQNSVFDYRIIEQDGQKIDYFNYNSFTSASIPEVNEAFAYFANQQVDEMILDFRYNSGGQMDIAEWLAQLIAGYQVSYQPFEVYIFNDRYSYLNTTIYFDNWENSLNLNRVYVLTTSQTSSASESVINDLKPYIDGMIISLMTLVM